MPTKKGRITTNLDTWLYDLVVEDAKRGYRSEAQQVSMIVERHYAERKQEAELFQNQQPLKKQGQEKPLVFGKPLHEPAQSSKRHATQRQAKS